MATCARSLLPASATTGCLDTCTAPGAAPRAALRVPRFVSATRTHEPRARTNAYAKIVRGLHAQAEPAPRPALVSRRPVRTEARRAKSGGQSIVQSALCVHFFERRAAHSYKRGPFDPDEPTRFGAWCDALGYPARVMGGLKVSQPSSSFICVPSWSATCTSASRYS